MDGDFLMSKRFTDSEKWKDPWFNDLPTSLKLLWIYLLDNCNHAGIWKINYKLSEFQIGVIPEWGEGVGRVPKMFTERVYANPEYWFIPKFLAWQYGRDLKRGAGITSAIEMIEHEGFLSVFERVYGEPPHSHGREKAKAKAKAMAKAKAKEGGMGETEFTEVWAKYPNHDGRKDALRYFINTVKDQNDLDEIKKALENYLSSDRVAKGFIKNGSTWFNNWRDWLDFDDVKRQEESCLEKQVRERNERLAEKAKQTSEHSNTGSDSVPTKEPIK